MTKGYIHPLLFSISLFSQLVLVLGDLHIPSRKPELPAEFKDLLVPGKMQHVLCTGMNHHHILGLINPAFLFPIILFVSMLYYRFTPSSLPSSPSSYPGNVGSKTMEDYLRTLASSVHIVKVSGSPSLSEFTLASYTHSSIYFPPRTSLHLHNPVLLYIQCLFSWPPHTDHSFPDHYSPSSPLLPLPSPLSSSPFSPLLPPSPYDIPRVIKILVLRSQTYLILKLLK